MTSTTLIAMALVGGGLSLTAVGVLSRVWAREERLAEILDLPWGEQDVDLKNVTERHGHLVERIIGGAGVLIDQIDGKGALMRRLELARVPMRPGEFVLFAASLGVIAGVLITLVTGALPLGVIVFVASPVAAWAILGRRINKRRARFQSEFPDALGLIASSLSAGHTFLRAIQIMTEEAEGPIAEEFGRVMNETQLGGNLVDALDRMAGRLEMRDVDWVVQAIKIQQTVGGKLADLLHTLADFIRARYEVQREIQVLTAEGRMSAWVIGALPAVILLVTTTSNPGYIDPMFTGWGPFWLAVAGVMTVGSIAMILKMVKSVEV